MSFFRKTSFVHSRSRTYYALLLGYFNLKFLLVFAINFLFITVRTERKVRLYVNLFDFFTRWILICLTWNLSHFVPNSVEIFTWNFRKKLFQMNFSEFLCKPKLFSTETHDISLFHIVLKKKIHTSTFTCLHLAKRTRP